ncbi:hypothetical protein DV872_09165 [Oceanispirochaeta sp. M1]|nr:hypothetical protein DV872_09165 [Oceanispirochaeta sp. M1]
MFGDEASYKIKKEYISEALVKQDPSFIQQLRDYDSSDEDYDRLIDYVVEKAGDLVFQEEYSYAYKVLDAVLYNNLAHSQAQDLYLLLDEILREDEENALLAAEAEAEVKAEEQRKLDEEAQRQAEEDARVAEERKVEEQHQASLDEKQQEIDDAKAYVESISTVSTDNFSYYAALFPLDLIFFNSDVYQEFNDMKESHLLYGMAAQIGANFRNPVMFMNLDIVTDFGFLEMSNDESGTTNFGINANYSIGISKLPIPITLRVGYLNNSYSFPDSEDEHMAIIGFSTPSFGIGIWNLTFFDKLKINLSLDYYISSFFIDYLDVSFGGNLGISYDFFENEKFKLYSALTTQTLFLKEEGMVEDYYSGKIGVGISFND